MPDQDSDNSYLTDNEKLLAEIRARFDYCQTQWEDIRREAQTDMRYVSGNPWPAAEAKLRKDAGRPCLVMDELSQYTNQLINDVRQNKRAVKVVPRGEGANDKTAEFRGDLIREIEYKSNAQSAYTCAFENICNRSYGGWKIVRRYVDDETDNQEIRIIRIPNPDSSYPDPDCKEQDFSDARYWFLLDLIPRKEFKNRWPTAKITDFNGDHVKTAPNWIKEDQIQVAEYWRVETTEEKIKTGRVVKKPKIVQYITNGVEILETNPEPDGAKYIPIVWLTGKELYVDEGSGPKRMLMSLIRLARDPQMLVNYYRTCEAEVVGMTPKTPFIGAVGQFHNPEQWQASTTQPVAYLEFVPQPKGAAAPIGPPQRQPYEPMVQPLEMGAESARRAVQAAMGLSALPTNAQKFNDKSGVALEQIDANEDRGSFHFIDNYELGLEYSGRILNNLITCVYDYEGEVGARKQDETHYTLKINTPAPVINPSTNQSYQHDLTTGEYEVTLSTGPSFQSERDQANEFVETMIPNLEQLPLDPVTKSKLMSLLIKLKNVGPIGDEMIKLLAPPDQQQAQQFAQLQTQYQQAQQNVQDLNTQLQKLLLEKQGKVIDNQFQAQENMLDRKLKLDIAEIEAKSQDKQARDQLTQDLFQELQVHAASAAEQAVQHAHEKFMANQAAQNAQSNQQAGQAHEAGMSAMAQAAQVPQPGNNGAAGA